MKNWAKAMISLAIPQAAGITAALITDTGESSWFQGLSKPQWNPPGWLFGPVWTTLYLLMGIALYLVWKSDAPARLKRPAILFWTVQMALLWSFLFFDMHLMDIAFHEIVILWLVILLTIFAFARISKTAAWLLVPYISWVSFAAILNYTFWQMNA